MTFPSFPILAGDYCANKREGKKTHRPDEQDGATTMSWRLSACVIRGCSGMRPNTRLWRTRMVAERGSPRGAAATVLPRLCQSSAGKPGVCASLGQVLVSPGDNGEDALIAYLPSFLDETTATRLFLACRDSVAWQREVDDFGPQERLSCYVGDEGCSFAYVGLFLRPQPWPWPLRDVRDRLNELLRQAGLPPVTACLMNQYPPGQGQIVWHRDEIRAHGTHPVIVSVSLSPEGSRHLELRHNSTQHLRAQPLAHGSAFIMAGAASQEQWMHRLPLSAPAPHRISLTFRSITEGYEDKLAAARGPARGGRDGGSMDDCVSQQR